MTVYSSETDMYKFIIMKILRLFSDDTVLRYYLIVWAYVPNRTGSPTVTQRMEPLFGILKCLLFVLKWASHLSQ